MTVINTNIASLQGQKNLINSKKSLDRSLERLSTGLRINSAKDDAAGLAIASNLTSAIRGSEQAIRNANDGISMLQVADGAMKEITNMLQRMNELAVQSATGSLSATEQGYLNTEFQDLDSEIDRIAKTTKFNGTNLLDGTSATVTIQVGANDSANDRIDLNFIDAQSTALAVDSLAISDQAGSQGAITAIAAALGTINTARAGLGASQNRLEYTVSNLQNSVENLSASRSKIEDADFARETAEMTKAQILQQAGVSVLSQANQAPQNILGLLQ